VARPARPPIGLVVASTAKALDRAFDDALGAVGGSRVNWLILMNLRRRPDASQRELADAIGIRGATLTHHLDAMEARGLLRRQRDPANRRVHRLTLTPRGEDAFSSMLSTVSAFDRRLRHGLDDAELARLERTLATLRANVEA
jgi:MarR family transcriptional regulator for hemolysin